MQDPRAGAGQLQTTCQTQPPIPQQPPPSHHSGPKAHPQDAATAQVSLTSESTSSTPPGCHPPEIPPPGLTTCYRRKATSPCLPFWHPQELTLLGETLPGSSWHKTLVPGAMPPPAEHSPLSILTIPWRMVREPMLSWKLSTSRLMQQPCLWFCVHHTTLPVYLAFEKYTQTPLTQNVQKEQRQRVL